MCKYQKYSKGFKCYGDDYPAMMQGQYLPGDEPGYHCKLNDDFCSMEDCPFGEEYWQSECGDDDGYYDPQEEKADYEYCRARDERGMSFGCANVDEVLWG